MAPTQEKRPFPKQLFEQLSKVECERFIEALHYTMEASNTADVKEALAQFQNLFPFTRVIGGLARLGLNGAFEDRSLPVCLDVFAAAAVTSQNRWVSSPGVSAR